MKTIVRIFKKKIIVIWIRVVVVEILKVREESAYSFAFKFASDKKG
jgi:hypothetical protein